MAKAQLRAGRADGAPLAPPRKRARGRLLRLVWSRPRLAVARLPRRLRRARHGLGAREVAVAYVMVLTSVLATALMMELTLRGFGYSSSRPSAPARLMDDAHTVLLDCYPSNPRGYFDIDLRAGGMRERYKAVAAARRFEAVAERAPHAVEFHYNALGFRDRAFGPPAAGHRRVVVLGDSFTEGQGVKEPHTFARVLERTLGGSRWEVRNAGRRGTDFPALYDTFQTVLPYGADVVVYSMVLNDAVQAPSFHDGQGYLNDWMTLRGRLTANGGVDAPLSWYAPRLWAFVRDRWESRSVSIASTRCYRDMYGEPNGEGWRRTQFLIRSMDAQARAHHARFVVALWPWLVDLQKDYPFEGAHQVIRQFCRDAGITFLDLRASLSTQPAESLWVHPVDWHPNEIAHRLVGEALADAVR